MSIRYKLLLLLLLLGITILVATGAIAYVTCRDGLTARVMDQLTSVRRSKAYQLESYYHTIQSHVQTLSEDRMFIDAMREFRTAYRKLDAIPVSAELRQSLLDQYNTRFYPELQRLALARPRVEDYLPIKPAGFHLQRDYIVNNRLPRELRREMESAADGSEYSQAHAKYHHSFRNLVEKFGYHDLYLVDAGSGRIIYSVAKQQDFATSLSEGPYRETNLAKVVRQCLSAENADDTFFSDFAAYEPSLGAPAQFVAGPLFSGAERLGVLALQLSSAEIDNVISGHRNWVSDGLRQSGDSGIVGEDYLLRSSARTFLQNPEKHLALMKSRGVPQARIDRIRAYGTTILQQEVRLPSVTAALAGQEGTIIQTGSSGNKSLVSFMPLHIQGLHWTVASRMDLAEALEPVTELRLQFRNWGIVLLILTAGAAVVMTRAILRPVSALVDASRKVGAGDLKVQVPVESKDELGRLSKTFNSMVASIREKTELIEQKNRENEALLLNILPGEIATRLKSGEEKIADSFPNVTVLFGDLVGFTTVSSRIGAGEVVDMLNGLFTRFDEAAHELGIEKIKTIGDAYMAVCGLPRPVPDHADRMVRMALRMTQATADYGRKLGADLQLRVGINSGPVVAGVIGTSKFIYDLWGDTVNLASRMESHGVPGCIQVTRSVYEQLEDHYAFESRGVIEVKGKGAIETWLLSEVPRPVGAHA